MKKEVKTCALAIVLVLMCTMVLQLILPLSVVKAHTNAGDINKDGVLNTSDVAQLRTAIVNNTDLGGTPKLGDLNEDGMVDVTDLMILRKAIVDEVKVVPIIQIGDYIDYTPDTASAYSKDKLSESTYYATEDITQDSLKWQILRKYDDGSMDLIGSPTAQGVTFKGVLGYNNGVYVINDICKSLYSKSSAGIEARSVNINDFEYWLEKSEGGVEARNTYVYNVDETTSAGGQYGDLVQYTGSKSFKPDILEKTNNASDSYYSAPTTNTYTGGGSSDILDAKQTFYGLSINETNYGEGIKSLKSSSRIVVASRYVLCGSTAADFGLFVSNSTDFWRSNSMLF